MRDYLALALLALLSSASAAEFSARFSPDSSAFTLSAVHLAYAGHYGNYTVFLQVYPLPASITVTGQDASSQALAAEIAWLQGNGALETSCNATAILVFSYTDYYCAPAGRWQDCSQSSECRIAPVAPGPSGEAGRSLSQPAAAPMVQKAGANQENGGGKGIGAEQLLPLVAAFVAVVVVSYLMLQRQETVQIGPQEAKLLENETRAGIMQELSVADKIPTDLSARLGKSKATIVEHLVALSQAGFVEKVETPGKKFVFYRLTRKGRVALLKKAA